MVRRARRLRTGSGFAAVLGRQRKCNFIVGRSKAVGEAFASVPRGGGAEILAFSARTDKGGRFPLAPPKLVLDGLEGTSFHFLTL